MMNKRKQTEADETWSAVLPYLDAEMAALPDVQREAIVLRYLKGLPQAEAARELRCPEETVHTRVNRGLAKLRERLRRKGAVVSMAALAVLLGQHACQAAPAGLAATIKCACAGKGLLSLAAVETADAVMSDFILAKVKLGTVTVAGLATFAAFAFFFVCPLFTPRTASTALKPAVPGR